MTDERRAFFERVAVRKKQGPYVVESHHGLPPWPAVNGPAVVLEFEPDELDKALYFADRLNAAWAVGYEQALLDVRSVDVNSIERLAGEPDYKRERDMLKQVQLGVVTIRIQGEEQDKDAILAGREALMSKSKVRLDSNGLDENGNGVPEAEKAKPNEIQWDVLVGGLVIGSFRGDEHRENLSWGPWELGGQGAGQLEESAGHTVVLKWRGFGQGTTTAAVVCTHRGGASSRVDFPKAD